LFSPLRDLVRTPVPLLEVAFRGSSMLAAPIEEQAYAAASNVEDAQARNYF
jgi:hypothetical protein